MTDSTAKPSLAQEKATQIGALSKGGTVLLGVFGAKDDLKAMIREPFRGTRIVSVGDRTGMGPIKGIDTDGIIVEQNGEARRLALVE